MFTAVHSEQRSISTAPYVTRAATDGDRSYEIVMVKPGALPTRDGSVEAPHIDVSVSPAGC